jgi:NitT/TauT family transport system substrate-binding protein
MTAAKQAASGTAGRLTRFRRLQSSLAAVLCALALALAGCSETPPEPLRMASSPWPGYEPFYLARDLGYLAANEVRLFELPSADITLESFRNRSADLATLTLDEVLDLQRSGLKLRILAVVDASNGADAVMATPAVRTLADLKGRRIATENIPLGIYLLSRALDAAGLDHQDVEVVSVSENKHENLYRQGKADAIVTMEPVKSRLAALGAHPIFDSSQIPNEILDLLVVHEAVYQQRRAEVCKLVRQWFRALDYMKTNPDDAYARMGKRLGTDADGYRAMLAGLVLPTLAENKRLLAGAQPGILKPAKQLAEVMQREKQLAGPVDLTVILDPSFQTCLQ